MFVWTADDSGSTCGLQSSWLRVSSYDWGLFANRGPEGDRIKQDVCLKHSEEDNVLIWVSILARGRLVLDYRNAYHHLSREKPSGDHLRAGISNVKDGDLRLYTRLHTDVRRHPVMITACGAVFAIWQVAPTHGEETVTHMRTGRAAPMQYHFASRIESAVMGQRGGQQPICQGHLHFSKCPSFPLIPDPHTNPRARDAVAKS